VIAYDRPCFKVINLEELGQITKSLRKDSRSSIADSSP